MATPPQQDLIQSLARVTTAPALSTQSNRSLPSPRPAPAIPARVGSAKVQDVTLAVGSP